MVKGVNKTVIEVNNTGSRLFEKIVFYVTPEYGNMSAKQLRKAASAFTFNFSEANTAGKTLRKRIKNKKIVKICWVGGAIIAALTVALIIIL